MKKNTDSESAISLPIRENLCPKWKLALGMVKKVVLSWDLQKQTKIQASHI